MWHDGVNGSLKLISSEDDLVIVAAGECLVGHHNAIQNDQLWCDHRVTTYGSGAEGHTHRERKETRKKNVKKAIIFC